MGGPVQARPSVEGRERFCYPENIEREIARLFNELARNNYFRDPSRQVFATQASTFLSTLNAIHPSREGSAITSRARLVGFHSNQTVTTSHSRISYFAPTNFRASNVVFGIKQPDRLFHVRNWADWVGKSNLLDTLAMQDLLASQGFVHLDPHGDQAESSWMAAADSMRDRVIHPKGPDRAQRMETIRCAAYAPSCTKPPRLC